MMKYLLPAWQKAIDKKVDEQVNEHVAKDPNTKSENHYRGIWYHVCVFLNEEVKLGNMMEEFRPFADVYAKSQINASLESIEMWKRADKEREIIKEEIAAKKTQN